MEQSGSWHRRWFQDEQFSKAKVKRSRHSVITSFGCGNTCGGLEINFWFDFSLFTALGRGWRRSSVTRLPQSEKAALQASSKMADKVLVATGVAEEEKENSTESGTESPDDLPPAKTAQSSVNQQRTVEFKEVPSKPVRVVVYWAREKCRLTECFCFDSLRADLLHALLRPRSI